MVREGALQRLEELRIGPGRRPFSHDGSTLSERRAKRARKPPQQNVDARSALSSGAGIV
jgi:hypothetical protein